jgi:hypothetical protein
MFTAKYSPRRAQRAQRKKFDQKKTLEDKKIIPSAKIFENPCGPSPRPWA